MVLIEEECSLCEVNYPYYSLRRCYRCGRFYCRNCFLYDEEGKTVCLKCAKRRIMPKGPRSKYTSLSTYLARRANYSNRVILSFGKIEEVIDDRLPSSAYSNKPWWSNVRGRSPSEAWLTVGWSVEDVNLDTREVTFRKDQPMGAKIARRRRRRKPVSLAFKALALRRKPLKPPGPSKTKIVSAQARLKNIERRSSSIRAYKGKFKPKRAYEKRLYKIEEEPE